MTHIECQRTGPLWQLYCSSCHIPLDLVSSSVVTEFSRKNELVLCFECDGGSDQIPYVLASETVPYFLIIDGIKYHVDPWNELPGFSKLFSLWKGKFEKVLKDKTERIRKLCRP